MVGALFLAVDMKLSSDEILLCAAGIQKATHAEGAVVALLSVLRQQIGSSTPSSDSDVEIDLNLCIMAVKVQPNNTTLSDRFDKFLSFLLQLGVVASIRRFKCTRRGFIMRCDPCIGIIYACHSRRCILIRSIIINGLIEKSS
jgi:hypothetical protein